MISNNLKLRILTSTILFFLIYLIYSFNYILVYSLIILGVLSLLEFINISNKIIKKKLYLYIFNIIFVFYIFIFCIFFFIFSNILQLKIILFAILIGCIFSDVGGFVFGKIFKGSKLTKISPKKTRSGAYGSLIFTCLALSSFVFYFTNHFNFKIIIISTITSIACQLGDLFFSFLKRKANLKDTGNFLPGHGGVLDRLDGILLGVPIGFISLTLIY